MMLCTQIQLRVRRARTDKKKKNDDSLSEFFFLYGSIVKLEQTVKRITASERKLVIGSNPIASTNTYY